MPIISPCFFFYRNCFCTLFCFYQSFFQQQMRYPQNCRWDCQHSFPGPAILPPWYPGNIDRYVVFDHTGRRDQISVSLLVISEGSSFICPPISLPASKKYNSYPLCWSVSSRWIFLCIATLLNLRCVHPAIENLHIYQLPGRLSVLFKEVFAFLFLFVFFRVVIFALLWNRRDVILLFPFANGSAKYFSKSLLR